MLLVGVVFAMACGPKGEATLDVTALPSSIGDQGEVTTLKFVATTAEGKIGTGTVKVTAPAGTLGSAELTLDAFGTAQTTFSCAVAQNIDCAGPLKLTAKWTTASGTVVTSELNVSVKATTGGGGGGAGGGAGASCTAPEFKLTGTQGVVKGTISLNASNADFYLFNNGPPPVSIDPGGQQFDLFLPGRGVLIFMIEKATKLEYRVFLFHNKTGEVGTFSMGPFNAGDGKSGQGVRVYVPTTACNGFEGGNFNVTSLDQDSNGLVRHMPNGGSTYANGVICF
jgi:hypothetical protein